MTTVPDPPTHVIATAGAPVGVPVFTNGVMHWAGDWSGIAGINYHCTDPVGAAGGPCISIPKAGQWAYWLPYPKPSAGSPSINGIGANLTGCTHLTLAVRPTLAGLTPTISFSQAQGSSPGQPFGVGVAITQAKYGPAILPAAEWSTYVVPLADFEIGTPGWIYTFIVQQHGVTPQAWCLDEVSFY